MSKYLTLVVTLKSPEGKLIGGNVSIKDEWAVVKFSDPKVTELLFKEESKLGKLGKFVKYDRDAQVMVEKYPDKSKEEIKDILQAELKKGGAVEVQVKEGKVEVKNGAA